MLTFYITEIGNSYRETTKLKASSVILAKKRADTIQRFKDSELLLKDENFYIVAFKEKRKWYDRLETDFVN